MQVPTIDISAYLSNGTSEEKAAVAQKWNEAYSTLGFANIVGHGIATEELKSLQAAARAFFDLPEEQKKQLSFPEKRSQGYYQVGAETVNKTFECGPGTSAPPDLVETLTFAFVDWERDSHRTNFENSIFRPNLWPNEPAGFKDQLHLYHEQLSHIARVMMRISADALGLNPDYFDVYYRRMATSLRLAHYPEQNQQPEPGQLRYGAHTDYMGYTVLLQDNAPGGLQVQDEDGSWIDATPVPGAFTVNCGDLLSRWTNSRWKSNIHRVVNPPRDKQGSARRLSIVMFTGPDYESTIECLPTCLGKDGEALFPPVKCWDDFQAKVKASLAEGVQDFV